MKNSRSSIDQAELHDKVPGSSASNSKPAPLQLLQQCGETPERVSLLLESVQEHVSCAHCTDEFNAIMTIAFVQEHSLNRSISDLETISWEESPESVLDAMAQLLQLVNDVPLLPLHDADGLTEQQEKLHREIQREKVEIKCMLKENFSCSITNYGIVRRLLEQ